MAFESIFEDDQITSRIRPFSLERKCQPKLRMASNYKLGKILNPLLWRIKVCVHGMKGWHGLRNHKRLLVSKSDKKNKVEGELICIDWIGDVLWADSSLRDHWREMNRKRRKKGSRSVGMGDLEKGILARTGIGCKAKSRDVKASNNL